MTQRDYDCFFGRKHGFDRAGLLTKEELPHTDLALKKIAEQTGISRSSILRMMKKRNI